ncbi:MAG: ATP-dependent DNA helicase [Alphaproteobacteria bacterium]|jgi:ATP-dependent DNA helicase DinG|nr:ATP-dependent DNA helicase [Alphaproteobacteria bacterium]MDP6516093.1 ATP-dependent DNA helicase [Alphaproteobacteria bacterium]
MSGVSDAGGGLPGAPVLVAGARGAVWLSADGEVSELSLEAAAARLRGAPPVIVCHMPAVARRLAIGPFPAFDVLELHAFTRPAKFCLPTVRGLAAAAGLDPPGDPLAEAIALREAAATLLAELARPDYPEAALAAAIAMRMTEQGWTWGPAVVRALGVAPPAGGLDVWARLKEWSDGPPEPPPGHFPVEPGEARARLAALLGANAEPRPEQADYASAATFAFAPRDEKENPNVVLAEAGTGVGKTLGYIAPASVWADKNAGAVWLSTYTKNLQRQIDRELDRLYPDPAVKRRKVVVRKGRENYLCLLNLEEAVGRAGGATLPGLRGDAVALGLMGRWAQASRDGDMVGGDFPSWLVDLLGRARSLGLSDRRGECIYSACPHYRKCFVERAVRKARHGEIVIANHALVMTLAAAGEDEAALPTRYVLDEGHHVFDAADHAFSSHLSGLEGRELRRWLLGAESAGRGRARGLKRRAEDLVAGEDEAARALRAVLSAARALPGDGWRQRVADRSPRGPAESFLAAVHQQVSARCEPQSAYGSETDARPPVPGLLEAATALDEALTRLAEPMARLEQALAQRLDADAEDLDTATRIRLEATRRSLRRRRLDLVAPWRAMLKSLSGPPPEAFVDWFSIDRRDRREADVGMHRHWVDPTEPFVESVLRPAHGALITSATLRDGTGDAEADWAAAETRTGAGHLARPPVRAALPSPFDYGALTRVMVVTDVARDDPAQVAAAYRALFLAAGGGALGLFTAIWRLRRIHQHLAAPLDEAGLILLAQHVDGLDATTLVEIFRAEPDSCLLGTDALRDGVDVPGGALRLIVFDRVPWPRPDILHRARRARFGGRGYDDRVARLRLKQAYGRLVRRADDYGVFVLLDSGTPSRLLGAFPEGLDVARIGLAETVAETRGFIGARRASELTASARLS